MTRKQKQNVQKKKKGGRRKKQYTGADSFYLKALRHYDNLVRDPCSADLAHPPYTGTDTGYLIRVTDQLSLPSIVIGSGTVGARIPVNGIIQICPTQYPAYLSGSGSAINPSLGLVTQPGNFLASSSVRSYRCVAACLKWVPAGSIANRSGVVGVGYMPSPPAFTTGVQTISSFISSSLERVPNGGGMHEVRWLPTAADEAFNGFNASVATGPSNGTLFAVLNNVDGTVLTPTTAGVDGFFEYTGVYEWIPQAANSLTAAPMTPLPFNTQQHQSTIGDLGAYLLQGVRVAAGAAGRGVMTGMMQTVAQTLGSNTSTRRYASSVPLILSAS